jgi:hypothetical protein
MSPRGVHLAPAVDVTASLDDRRPADVFAHVEI